MMRLKTSFSQQKIKTKQNGLSMYTIPNNTKNPLVNAVPPPMPLNVVYVAFLFCVLPMQQHCKSIYYKASKRIGQELACLHQ